MNDFRGILPVPEPKFIEAVSGHLPGDVASQGRVPLVLETLRRIADAS